MDSEVMRVTRIVRDFDRNMYARRTSDGVIRVMHTVPKLVPYDVDGMTLLVKEPSEYLVFSMTETFGSNSKPANWGALPLQNKLRELHHRDVVLKEIEESKRLAEEKKDRDLKAKCEDVARESRDTFKKTFNDVIVRGGEDPRRKTDRSIKWR